MAHDTEHSNALTAEVEANENSAKLGRASWSLLSFVALLALWQAAAWLVGDPIALPTPFVVLETLWREFKSGALWTHVSATLIRVVASFIIAMFIGTAIGIALGRSKIANNFFGNWLIFFLNLPALVSIVLCYVWLGQNDLAAILAVTINKVPNVAVILRDGTASLSRDLDEMAHVYRFGWWKTFRHVTLPQLAPFLSGAARSGLSLIWKIVLVVELFGLSEGVGVQIHTAFQLFDVASILAYAIAFIAVVQLIEIFILQPMDSWANRWRR